MSDKDLEIKTKKCKNENTYKAEKRADKAFIKFLVAMGVDETDTNYWNYSEPRLDEYLAKFWFGVRKEDADDQETSESDPQMKERLYKANSLRNIRYSLNRVLKSKGHLYDITNKNTASFQKSQKAFNDAIKELKAEVKGDVKSHPEIEETGKFVLVTLLSI